MSEAVEFGSKDVADRFRDRHTEHLCSDDDKRKRTVTLASDAPESVVDEAKQAAAASGGGGSGAKQTGSEGPCGELTGKQLGALRRSWGAYIGGIEQALESFETINDIRADVCQDPLGMGDLDGDPENVTERLIEELRATEGAVPDGMTAEDVVDVGHNAESPGELSPENHPAMAKALDADISAAPEELFRGVGSEPMADANIRAEGEDERAAISSAMADESDGGLPNIDKVPDDPDTDPDQFIRSLDTGTGSDANLSDVDQGGVTPPGDLEGMEDLDGINGWEYREVDVPQYRGKHLIHDTMGPGQSREGEPYSGGTVTRSFGKLRVKKHGGRFSGRRSKERYSAVYSREHIVDQDEGDRHTYTSDTVEIAERVDEWETAVKAAWRFAALDPAERSNPAVNQFKASNLRTKWGRKYPAEVGPFSPTDSAPDGAIGWSAPAPGKASASSPHINTYLVAVRSNGDPEEDNGWGAFATLIGPNGDSRDPDGSAYDIDKTDTTWRSALQAAVSHMQTRTGDEMVGSSPNLPRFSINTNLRVLRPLLNVANRVAGKTDNSTAYTRLDVSDGSLSLFTPGTTGNVAAMAKIEIDPSDLDSYRVQEEGTAYIDIERFWRHLTDAGLTSDLRLTLTERDHFAPPRVDVEIDGERVEVSSRSNPANTVSSYLIPEETTLQSYRDPVEMNDFDYIYGGSSTVDTFTSALQAVDESQDHDGFWLSAGASRLAVSEADVSGMDSIGVKRVGDADASLGRGSAMFTTSLWDDVLRGVPRQSGKPMSIEFGQGDPEPGHAGNGPAEIVIPVGDSSLTLLFAPRVGDEQPSPPVGHDRTRPNDVIPSEVFGE